MMGERVATPGLENPIPFENQGVCIVETSAKKQIYFTHFTTEELDEIAYAVKSKESLLDPFNWPRGSYNKVRARDNLAIRFYANTAIPWGAQLMDRKKSLDTMLTTRAEIEYLEDKIPLRTKATHLVTMELLRRIKSSLGSFGDWTTYSPKFLKR